MNGTNWDRCKEYVKSVWLELTKALEEINDEEVAWLGLELAEKARDMWETGIIALTKFKVVDEKEENNETEGMTLAIIRDDTPTTPSIIITPRALSTRENLLRTLLHELIHAAGFISENEEEDEALTEYLTDLIMNKLMKLQRIQNIPNPPSCTSLNIAVNASNTVTYLSKNPDKYAIINEKTLKDYIDKIRDPQEWEKGLINPMKELLGTVNEITDLCEALKKVYHNKTLKDIRDIELRERMKTIIAGGLSKEKNPENALAPLLWKLFGIEIISTYNRRINNKNEIKELISVLENEGIENIAIAVHRGMICTIASKLNNVLELYLKSLKGDGYRRERTIKPDIGYHEELILRYIPKPGDRSTELNKLLSKMFNLIYKLLPGTNPFTTFIVTFSPIYLDDLMELVNINNRIIGKEVIDTLENIIKFMGLNQVIAPRSFYANYHIITPRGLIDSLKNEKNKQIILEYSSQILLMHHLGLTQEYIPGIIGLVQVVLSKEYDALEKELLPNQSSISQRKVTAEYLLTYLNIAASEANRKNTMRNNTCTLHRLLCERACYITNPPYEILEIIDTITRDILYSPAMVVYTRDVLHQTKRGYTYVDTYLERMKIPDEDSILRDFCSEG